VFSNDSVLTADSATQMIGYFKASNAVAGDYFGNSVALSGDGTTLAVGAYLADYSDDEYTENDVSNAGAVYLFSNSSGVWAQTGYVSSSVASGSGCFGRSVALSGDGTRLAVGENNGAYSSDVATATGNVQLFDYDSDTGWTQSGFVVASNAEVDDYFGFSVALSDDGTTLAVGAHQEDGDDTEIITDSGAISSNNTATTSGAVYLFDYDDTADTVDDAWSQSAYVKASNAGGDDYFGYSVSLDDDGDTLVVGAYGEDGGIPGVSSTVTEGSGATASGAAYLFSYDETKWSQDAYVKASTVNNYANFGYHVALSGDGATLAVGASKDEVEDGASDAGVVYLFSYESDVDYSGWSQIASLSASNAGASDFFGGSVAVNGD
jgi:hypothetical protein